MARGLLYIIEFDSDKYKYSNRIEIWEEGFIGTAIEKALGAAPILKREKSTGGVYGTSLELTLQSDLNSEFVRLYTTDNKKFLVKLYRDTVLRWQGCILPEQYTEPSVSPPYDVSIAATDGLGVLKGLDFTLIGYYKLFEIFKYCLDKTGLNLEFEVICNLYETTQDLSKTMLEEVGVDAGMWKDLTCYDVLVNMCSSLRMSITQYKNRWRLARFADLASDSMIYTNNLVYINAISNSFIELDNISSDVYPIDFLTREILGAYKSCNFTRTFIKRDSFFYNPTFKLLEGWTATGMVSTIYINNVNYALLLAEFAGQKLAQTIYVDNSERDFKFSMNAMNNGGSASNNAFYIDVKLVGATETYYLNSEGWTIDIEKRKAFEMSLANINYINRENPTYSGGVSYYYSAGLSALEAVEISFNSFPVSGALTFEISLSGPENLPEGGHRTLLYITDANLTTETPKGLEVKALLSDSSEVASDIEIFFGDTETVDNSNLQMYNNLRFEDERYSVYWKIGIDSVQSSFFNMMIKDYICSLGLSHESLTGTVQSQYLDEINLVYEKYTGINFFLDTYEHNLLSDEMNVTFIELIPYIEIASIAEVEVETTNPEVYIEWLIVEGKWQKVYSVATVGTAYKRGQSSTLQDTTNSAIENNKRLSNFAKSLAALAQYRADAANLVALNSAEDATDALLRLNNIVANNVVSREEKASLKQLMSRLAAEIVYYNDSDVNYGAALTTLSASYDTLYTFLINTILLNTDESTSITDPQIVTYNNLFADFYSKRSFFATDISKIRAELLSFNNRIIAIDEAYNKAVAEYVNVYSDVALTGSYKTNLLNAKNNLYSVYTYYKNYLNSIISDNVITEAERVQANAYQVSYTTELYNFDISLQEARKCISANMSQTLNDISNDNVLVPFEKRITLKEWQTIQGEKDTLVAQAGTHSVNTTNYINAYNVLDAYIAPLLSNLDINSAIVGNTFRSNFKTYYDEKALLLKAITDAVELIILYKASPSVNAIHVSAIGVITPTTISCSKIKQVGSSAPVVTTEKILKYQVSGGSITAYSTALTILASWSYIDFILYDADSVTIIDQVRVPLLFDGLSGPKGPTLRGPSEWAIGKNFESGTGSESFIDMVYYAATGKIYVCIVSHTSSSGILPTNSTYWIMSTITDFVATKVFFANQALIQNAIVRYLKTADIAQRLEIFSNVLSVFNASNEMCLAVHGGAMSDTQTPVSTDPANVSYAPAAVTSGAGGTGNQTIATFSVTAGNNVTSIPSFTLQAMAQGNESTAGQCNINVMLMLDDEIIDSLQVQNTGGYQIDSKVVAAFSRALSVGTHVLKMYYEYQYIWEVGHTDYLQVAGYINSDSAARITVSYVSKFVELCADGIRIKLASNLLVEFSFTSSVINILFRNGNYGFKITSAGFYKMINGADWVATTL